MIQDVPTDLEGENTKERILKEGDNTVKICKEDIKEIIKKYREQRSQENKEDTA